MNRIIISDQKEPTLNNYCNYVSLDNAKFYYEASLAKPFYTFESYEKFIEYYVEYCVNIIISYNCDIFLFNAFNELFGFLHLVTKITENNIIIEKVYCLINDTKSINKYGQQIINHYGILEIQKGFFTKYGERLAMQLYAHNRNLPFEFIKQE